MSNYPSYKKQFDLLNATEKETLGKMPHLEKIDGWLLLIEAVKLFDLSKQITSPSPIICEIGTWKGKSAYIFASAIKGGKGVLYCIDPFNGDGDNASKDTYLKEIKKLHITPIQNFKMTMNKYALGQYIKILPMLSGKARKKFNESRIDLLFIDGNHEYESVKNDYELWAPLIPSGGVIVLHDVGAIHVDGPKRVFEEYILNNPMWKNTSIVGEMAIATKI